MSLSAAQKGGVEVQVPGREIEDHVRVELHPDTHILRGYFEPLFCEEYAHRVMAMLKTPLVPGMGTGWPCTMILGLIL